MKEKNRLSVRRQFDSLRFYLSPRFLLGIALILASFISAYMISTNSNRTIELWAAKTDLAPGMILTTDNVESIRALLPTKAERYLDISAKIIGTTVVRAIGKDELIPSMALTIDSETHLRRVPISVTKGSFPSGLAAGALVDLFILPNKNSYGANPTTLATVNFPNLAIESIDDSGLDIGGAVSITLLVPETSVRSIIESLSGSQLILVKR